MRPREEAGDEGRVGEGGQEEHIYAQPYNVYYTWIHDLASVIGKNLFRKPLAADTPGSTSVTAGGKLGKKTQQKAVPQII